MKNSAAAISSTTMYSLFVQVVFHEFDPIGYKSRLYEPASSILFSKLFIISHNTIYNHDVAFRYKLYFS